MTSYLTEYSIGKVKRGGWADVGLFVITGANLHGPRQRQKMTILLTEFMYRFTKRLQLLV